MKDDGWKPSLDNSAGDTAMDSAPDQIDAGDGNDLVYASWGGDVVKGGAGDDLMWGDTADNISSYHAVAAQFHGDDYIDGEGGDDHIFGDGGADTLFGGAGNDVIYGDNTAESLAGEFHKADSQVIKRAYCPRPYWIVSYKYSNSKTHYVRRQMRKQRIGPCLPAIACVARKPAEALDV